MKKIDKLNLLINHKLNEYKEKIKNSNDILFNNILESTGYKEVLRKIYSLEIKKCVLEYELEKSSLSEKNSELVAKFQECESEINNLTRILDEKKKIANMKYEKLSKKPNSNIVNSIKQSAIDEYDLKRQTNIGDFRK